MSKSRVAERSVAYALKTAVEPAFGASFDLLATAPQGVKGLRALILSLATRGKLVAQSSDDHPASSLLGVLHEEWNHRGEAASKRRIGSDIPPVDPLTAIPPGWQYVRLGCVLDMFNGRAFKPTDWRPHGMPIVRIQNLNNIHAPYNYCDPVGVQPQHTIYKDAFLISWSGTPGTSFGAFIWTGSTAALNQHIFKCEQVAPVYQPAFLRLAINSQLDVLISKAHGGVGLQHVTKGTLENLILPLPSLAEQARIVARVEELMQLCDVLEAQGRLQDEQHARLVATLFDALAASASAEELAENWQRIATHFDLLLDRPEAVETLEQTLLQLSIRGLLVPQDPRDEPASQLLERVRSEKAKLVVEGRIKLEKLFSPVAEGDFPFELKVGWEFARLGQIGALGSSSRVHQKDWVSSGVPFYRAREIVKLSKYGVVRNELYITETLFKQLSGGGQAPEPGDVMITGVGTIGVPYVVKASDRFYFKDASVLIFKNRYRLNPDFLSLFMQSPYWVRRIHEESMGTTVDTLTISRASEVVVPLPPLAEQGRIVARVEQLRRLCADLRERLQQARATQSRLADAMVVQAGQSQAGRAHGTITCWK